MADKKEWKYCVVGNIVATRLDGEGVLRYGTIEFPGGRKVYLCGKYWGPDCTTIQAIGMNRFGRFVVADIPVNAVTNLRRQKTYKPRVVEIMNNWEFYMDWWGTSEEDMTQADRFVSEWNAAYGSLFANVE